LLTGCGNSSPQIIRVPVEKIVVEKVQAPEELLEPCLEPDLDSLETTGDLERVAAEAIVALVFCNKDKERLRKWQER
jgi:hypothetical protein